MYDSELVDQLRAQLIDRFTPEELCEILHLEVDDIFTRFIEECLRVDWGAHL